MGEWSRIGFNELVLFAFSVCVSDEFRSKVACENEIVQLTCNPYSRIAIYSASYGRTEYESIQCAQPQGVREESKCTRCERNCEGDVEAGANFMFTAAYYSALGIKSGCAPMVWLSISFTSPTKRPHYESASSEMSSLSLFEMTPFLPFIYVVHKTHFI